MDYTEEQKNGFFDAVESMKKYRRADLIDEKGRNLLEKLYTDLLPNEHVLKKALLNNTTFLIGRKGTGKSTIFLRLEQELRKKDNYTSCYIDVKTTFESSQTQFSSEKHLKDLIPHALLKTYLIERAFIQNVLVAVQTELDRKYNSRKEKIAKFFVKTKAQDVQEKLEKLKARIENNEKLKSIEIPVLKSVTSTKTDQNEKSTNKEIKVGGLEVKAEAKVDGVGGGVKTDSGYTYSKENKEAYELQSQFSSVFLQVFQIKEVIKEIQEILSLLHVDHLFILLDDFSEIDDDAITRFVDVLLAPLNNWSNEFIKFKLAAYPGRIYYGKIDPGKIDTINLDFYNLYSEFDRDKMEENAIDFTKRLVESRIQHFTLLDAQDFFDSHSLPIEQFYELLFKVSMNVPRILGYILSYCYQTKILYNKPITRSDIESASQKYYEDKIEPFFDTTTYSLLSIDEKISILQLKELKDQIVDKLLNVRKRIVTKDLTGSIYDPSNPYASHFYFDPRLEEFLKTLELNFFINKYNSLSDKDGNLSSIYCINYGLAQLNNLPWGKALGGAYRKYFIERPFNFNKLIKDFLSSSKKIHCINPDCGKNFGVEELQFLEFTQFKCNNCGSKVVVEPISQEIKDKIDQIEDSKLLPLPELKIIRELEKSEEPIYAREIAQEIDYSGQLIGWRGKKLDEDYGLVIRSKDKENLPYRYELTEEGKKYFN